MSTSRLSAIEAAYLALETGGAPIHVGSVGIFEGAPLLDRRGRLRIEELRARIAGRLDWVPRLRQHIARVPLDLGRPGVQVSTPTSRSPTTSTWSPCRRPATRPHSFASPRSYTWSRSVKIARCGS